MAIMVTFAFSLWSEFVGIEKAEQTALNWINYTANDKNVKFEIAEEFSDSYNGKICFYTFRLSPHGFVLISADDNVYPVLGYGLDSKISKNITNPALTDYLNGFKKQIEAVISEKRDYSDNQILWEKMLSGDFSDFPLSRDVSPLISANWNQDDPWNYQCPYDAAGPGNHVYAGCVATAMAQIIKYWQYPTQETGSHSYTHPDYGVLQATFGNYNFNLMQNNYATNETEQLIFDCGVSVEMDYGPEGSGASDTDTKNAFVNFFAYSGSTDLIFKNSHSDSEWNSILRNELDNGRPIFYTGSDTQFGHAFNCDGYQGTNYFHFNWGWSGWYNGYYYLNNLNPAGYNLTSNQTAIIGIQPPVIPESPQNLSAQLFGTDVLLIWEAPSGQTDEIVGYYIYRNDEQVYFIEGIASTSYFDMGLENGVYSYYITSYNGEMESEPSNNISVTIGTEVDENDISNSDNVLLQNYPNPFVSTTTINFSSAAKIADNTKLEIYNIKGQKIKQLGIADCECGINKVVWNGTNEIGNSVESGIYFYKLNNDRSHKIYKMIFMKN